MVLSLKLTFLSLAMLAVLPVSCFAAAWAGALVDTKCYSFEERNVNPTDTMTSVDRDTVSEIRYCSPSTKTKSFSIVQRDGTTFRLDADGNAKASDLVAKIDKKNMLVVVVTGERDKNTIKVATIGLAK